LIWLQLKTLLKELILPPASPLLLAILGLVLLKARPRLARAFLVVSLASLWLLSTPIVSDALTGLVELYPPLDFRQAADDHAYDTFQNARNSARILSAENVHRIILVTRATHMRRSVQEFTDAGFDVVPAPVGILAARDFGVLALLPNPDALLRSHVAIYELIGEPVRIFLSASHLRRQSAL